MMGDDNLKEERRGKRGGGRGEEGREKGVMVGKGSGGREGRSRKGER